MRLNILLKERVAPSCWRLFAFLVACCGVCFVARVCVTTDSRPGALQILDPGSAILLQFMRVP